MREIQCSILRFALLWQVINFSSHRHACSAIDGQICATDVCKETALTLLRNMDKTVHPCENFYQFACGNYMKSTAIPKDKLRVTPVTQLEDRIDFQLKKSIAVITKKDIPIFQNLKFLHDSCMDEDNIEGKSKDQFLEIVKSLGGWPVLEKSWQDKKFDWRRLMYDFGKAGFLSDFFVKVQLISYTDDGPNQEDISVVITPTRLPPGVLSKGNQNPNVKRYFDFMTDLTVMLGADLVQALTDLTGVLNFEVALAQINLRFFNLKKDEPKDHRTTIRELQKTCQTIPWLEFLTKILPIKEKLSESTHVRSIPPNILKSYCELLTTTPKRTLANYAFFHMAVDSLPYLSSRLRRLDDDYEDIFGKNQNPSKGQPRWRVCIAHVRQLMPVVAGALYVRRHFDQRDKVQVTKLLSYVEKSIRDSLKKVTWMHPKDHQTVTNKITAMISIVAYPGELLEDNEMNKFFKKLTLHPQKSFFKNVLSLNLFDVKLYHQRIGEPFDPLHWSGSSGHAAEVQAAYIPSHNFFYILAGFIQGIFFNFGNPKYINFAGVGSTIGHEMMHALDDCEENSKEPGKYYRNCWNPETMKRFREKTECLVNQYNDLATAEKLQANGRESVSENIADNAGVKHAYLAYNQWIRDYGSESKLHGMEEYSPKKMFWLAYANNFCEWVKPGEEFDHGQYAPTQLRVNAPLMNSPEFARDFECSGNAPMNPSKRCSVW